MVPLPRFTKVSGKPLLNLVKEGKISEKRLEEINQRTRDGGAEIVKFLEKGSAFYAPAASGVEMAKAYLMDEKKNLKGPNLDELLAQLNDKPNDINTILALADKYFASDMIDEAFNLLLSNYKNHKEKIKIKLINFFEALGNTNLKTIEYRKKFSSIMFS